MPVRNTQNVIILKSLSVIAADPDAVLPDPDRGLPIVTSGGMQRDGRLTRWAHFGPLTRGMMSPVIPLQIAHWLGP